MPCKRESKAVWLLVLAVALACGLAFGISSAKADNSQPAVTTDTPSQAAPDITSSVVSNTAVSGDSLVPMPDVYSFTVGNSASVHFDYDFREALCHDVLYAFTVDSADGSIDGVLPGNPAWPSAVESRNPLTVFDSGTSSPGASIDLPFPTGSIIAFRFDGCNTSYYSFPQANPNSASFVNVSLDDTNQTWQLGWEDVGSGGGDFNDMIVSVSGVMASGSTPPPTDTTPPTVSMSVDPMQVDSAGDNLVAGTTEQLSADASDDVGVAGVQFQLDGQNLGSEVTASPYTLNWDTTTTTDGSHTLTAIARDAAGNQTVSNPVTVTVLNDLSTGLGAGTEPNPISLPTAGCGTAATTGDMVDINSVVPDSACAQAATCKGQNTRWGTMKGHAQWNQWPSGITFWKYDASVRVCIDLKKRIVLAFDSNTQEATYVLHPFITYDNGASWSFGPLKLSTSYARVTDSFTTCPFFSFIHVGCFKRTFTITFHVYASTGQYQPEVTFN